jgi:hypothetical protein
MFDIRVLNRISKSKHQESKVEHLNLFIVVERINIPVRLSYENSRVSDKNPTNEKRIF